MANAQLEVEYRSDLGKNKVNKLKAQGFIPAVVYGGEAEPVPVLVEKRNLLKLYHGSAYGRNAVIELAIQKDGKAEKVNVVSYRFDNHPLSNHLVHVDFLRVTDDKDVELRVPVRIEGTAKGQRMGGVLIQNLHEIKISCKPGVIPEYLVGDITPKGLGEVLRVSELALPEGVSSVSPVKEVVATVDTPRAARAEMAAGGEEGDAAEGGEDAAEGENGNGNGEG